MSTLSFNDIVNDPAIRREVYEQFCLDAHRVMLTIDGNQDSPVVPVQCIYAWLVNLFAEETMGLWFAYWCTQTALATIYQDKVLSINGNLTHNPNGLAYHLVDDGRQEVHIRFSSRSKEHGDMFIYKPFRVCSFSRQACGMVTLCYYHLQIHISTHRLGQHDVRWVQHPTRVPLDAQVVGDGMVMTHEDDSQWVVLR